VTAQPRPGSIAAADPRVGQSVRIEGVEWEVTDHSSYWNAEGYRVTEWCCETEDTEAYLLREIRDGAPTRWFFTRKIDGGGVTLPAGPALPAWIEQNRTAPPPPALSYQGRAYQHTDVDEGTYEDEPGQRERKTTWEYWDAGEAHNLAVERWQDGRADFYHGAYIQPETVVLTGGDAGDEDGPAVTTGPKLGLTGGNAAASPAAALAAAAPAVAAKATNPFRVALVLVPFAYLLPFFFGLPFDEGMAVALGVAGACGWLAAVFRAPAAAGLAAVGLPVLGAVFWHFPPLSSTVGLGALLLAPAVIAVAGRRAVERGRSPVLYVAATVVAAPLLGLGFYHYFEFAPQPHSLAQIGLALGPAVIAVGVAAAIGTLVLASAEERIAGPAGPGKRPR
jgi:hypothetical protein